MEYIVLNNFTSIVSLLSSDLIATAINDTSNIILSIIKDDYKNYPDLLEILNELDLLFKLNIIKNIIICIPQKYKKIKFIKINIDGINNIINDIYKLLIKIINIINKHKLKYFSYIRKINYKKELIDLKKLSLKLDDRKKNLLELLKLIK